MAISETKGQGWKVKVILTQWRKASDILTSTLAAFLFSNQPKRERGREAHLNYYASTYNRGDNLCCSLTTLTTLILTAIFKVNSSLLCFLLYFPIHQVAPMCTPSNRPTCFFGPTRVHIPKEISVQPFWHCSRQRVNILYNGPPLWWRGPAVEHWSLADVLSLSCARLVADGWPLMWVSHPL